MLDWFGPETPLALRFFYAALILLAAFGAVAWIGVYFLWRGKTVSPPIATAPEQVKIGRPSSQASSAVVSHDKGAASLAFKTLFWVHQALLGLPSVSIGLDLIVEGKTTGIINAIGLLLARIGGTLLWGFASLMHRREIFDLPPMFVVFADNVARLENIQRHTGAVTAVAVVLSDPHLPSGS